MLDMYHTKRMTVNLEAEDSKTMAVHSVISTEPNCLLFITAQIKKQKLRLQYVSYVGSYCTYRWDGVS